MSAERKVNEEGMKAKREGISGYAMVARKRSWGGAVMAPKAGEVSARRGPWSL